ncbi:MAG: helix-hairpin-helix domain-containing protein [Bacteroidetes bacterium]|nr:helix-hairpin-helix domain-containing protein [Bacteroidota bacterium]MBL6944406.1 helix-hairpin-helix domain-containing protein [Bacteroidales bacterium]
MLNKLNNWIKVFFSLSKNEQRGIIVLVFIILFVVIVNLSLPHFFKSKSESNLHKYKADIELFHKEQQPLIDSANIEFLQNSGEMDFAIASQKIKPTKFNPNKLPVEAWKKMGFTDMQIRTIKNYEAKGGKFNRKEDLKKIYSISEVEYEILEPYISIPSIYKSKTGRIIKKNPPFKKANYQNVDINSADSSELINSLNLSPWLAKRTISYRNLLGGYVNKNQLKEVYGFTDSIYNAIESYITTDSSLITKIDINRIDFKNLLKHPYFDYNITNSFFNTRNKIGSFSSVDQLKLIDGINDSIFNKVRYYLYFRPSEK